MNTHKAKTEDIVKEAIMVVSSVNENRIINLDHLKDISLDNTEFIHGMLQAFKKESQLFLGDLEKHLSLNDFYAIQKTTHRMKPTGTYIGAEPLTVLVTSLEQAAKNANQKQVIDLSVQVKIMIDTILAEIDRHLL